MDMNWLMGLVYGLMSGFTAFLPVSVTGHQGLFLQLTGNDRDLSLYRLAAYLGALLYLIISLWPQLSRFRRERRIASIPAKRRRRQPNFAVLRQLQLLRMALIPMLLVAAGSWFLLSYGQSLWFLALAAAVNGILLYLPQFFRRGNKSHLTLSYGDSLLIGLGSGLGLIPGLSGIGGGISLANLCGSSRQTALDMGLLLSIPGLLLLSLLTFGNMLFVGSAGVSFVAILICLLVAAGAAIGAWVGVLIMRFLAVNIGYSGFSYYSWGMSLLLFILHLSI